MVNFCSFLCSSSCSQKRYLLSEELLFSSQCGCASLSPQLPLRVFLLLSFCVQENTSFFLSWGSVCATGTGDRQMKSAGVKQHIMVVSKFKKGVRTTKEEKYILVYYYKGTTFDSKRVWDRSFWKHGEYPAKVLICLCPALAFFQRHLPWLLLKMGCWARLDLVWPRVTAENRFFLRNSNSLYKMEYLCTQCKVWWCTSVNNVGGCSGDPSSAWQDS